MERIGTKAFLATLGEWAAGPGSSLHRKLEDAIGEAITTGLLRPGLVLPSERTLARDLGVSRSTVTIALNELKAQGLIESRHGSGTIVCAAVAPSGDAGAPMATILPGLLGGTGWERHGGEDGTASQRGRIDLAASSPGDARALPQVNVDLDSLVMSGPRHGYTPAGLPELRRRVAQRLSLDGVPTEGGQVLITNGAQHALALAFSELIAPDEAIIVEEPTYPGVIDLLAARRLRAVPLPRRAGGIDADHFARLVADSGARLAYLQTLVHNPTGRCADEPSVRRLAEAVRRTGITVIEDLVLSDLRFDRCRIVPLAGHLDAMHRRGDAGGRVVVVDSVSKLGWGGLRIGWLRADVALVDRLTRSRLTDDLGSSVPSQVISSAVLDQFDVIVESRTRLLARRAELVADLVTATCPAWDLLTPQGGLSLWITLPFPGAGELAQRAAREGVIIATGTAASVGEDDDTHIRLCFDRPEPQLIEGINRLARAWQSRST